MIDYAEDVETPTDEGLKKVASLAARQKDLEVTVAFYEIKLDAIKKELKQVQERDLPDAMSEVGLTSFTLADGSKVSVKQFYSGKIDEENCDAAYGWLRENGFEDLIKHELTVGLGRGQEVVAKLLASKLKELGLSFKDKEGVHPQTLAAFIKEQVEKGADFPLETFKAYVGNKTKISK